MKTNNFLEKFSINSLFDKFVLKMAQGSLPGASIPGGINLKLGLPTQEDLEKEFVSKPKKLSQQCLANYGEIVKDFQTGKVVEASKKFMTLKEAKCENNMLINLHEESLAVNILGEKLMKADGKFDEARKCQVRYLNLKKK